MKVGSPIDGSAPPGSRVLGLPSSTLGRVAGAAMFAAILLVVIGNLVRTQGTDDAPAWQEVAFVGALVGLLAADVVGLIAVFRRHERSWIVLLPTALITLAVVNELIQGAVLLFGLTE